MRASPARSKAPETNSFEAIETLDDAFRNWTGSPLFREHHAAAEIANNVHRFRAVDTDGVLGLAKDVTRLVVDRIDIALLRMIVAPPKGDNWGSIKSLEKVLATLVDHPEVRSMLSPLVGVYELRIGSAHLPSSKIAEAFALVGINPDNTPYDQALALLEATAETLLKCASVVRDSSLKAPHRSPPPHS